MSEELLPCPFCGSSAQIRESGGRFFASCCGADCFCCVGEAYDNAAMPEHVFSTGQEAANAWNRRELGIPAATLSGLREKRLVAVPVEPSDLHADAFARAEDEARARFQGFQHGGHLAIRDLARSPEQQEIWSSPADQRASGERFSTGPRHDELQRQCRRERIKHALRALLAAAQEAPRDATG